MTGQKKIFIGSGKLSKNGKYIRATISEKGIQELQNHLQEYLGHKFAKISIAILDEPNKHGKNVEMIIDLWQPSNRQEEAKEIPQLKEDNSAMPF